MNGKKIALKEKWAQKKRNSIFKWMGGENVSFYLALKSSLFNRTTLILMCKCIHRKWNLIYTLFKSGGCLSLNWNFLRLCVYGCGWSFIILSRLLFLTLNYEMFLVKCFNQGESTLSFLSTSSRSFDKFS